MKYFKLSLNTDHKKWLKGYSILSDLSEKGVKLNGAALCHLGKDANFKCLEYQVIREGKTPPVNAIGTNFIVFDESIEGISQLSAQGIQMVAVKHKTKNHHYILMYLYEWIDCVNWALSDYEPWEKGYIPKEYQSPKGNWFNEPVLITDKIPSSLDAFRLVDWKGAFNIYVSERLKDKILSLNFDHSFLIFKEIKTTSSV